ASTRACEGTGADGTGGSGGRVVATRRAHPPATGGIHGDDTLKNEADVLVAYQCHGTNVGPMGALRAGNGNETGGVPFVNDEPGALTGGVPWAVVFRDERGRQQGDRAIVDQTYPLHAAKEPSEQQVVVPVQEVGKRTGKSTDDPRAGIGIGEAGAPMYSLQARAQHGVIAHGPDVPPQVAGFANTAGETRLGFGVEQAPPITTRHGDPGNVLAFAENSRAEVRLEGGDGQTTGSL